MIKKAIAWQPINTVGNLSFVMWFIAGAICFLTLPLLRAAELPKPAVKPNIVYLLADDFGWGDLSVNNGTIPTPRLDRLFAQGVRLDNFMGWCVCSPTRAMLLTGRHPFRVGTGPEVGGELAREETTIAEGFKAHGYRTGIFGKWHNGDDPATPEYVAAFREAFKDMPNKEPSAGIGVNEHGFDEAWIYYGGGSDHFTRRTVGGRGPVSWWHNRDYRPDDKGYTDDLVTLHALEFIRKSKENPFFCYVPFQIVHGPLQAKEAELAGVDPKVTDEKKRIYAAMVQSLDKNVGMILDELDKLGLRENTIVVFTSDNGATKDGSNLPLRGGKHSVLEGGTRLPTAIHWPKGGLSGGRRWDGLCGALDMFPTLMAMAGLPMPETRPLDGKSIWSALRDNTASPVESCYWVWHNEDTLRTAQWRLHRFFDRVELYDIRADIGETNNVAAQHPDTVKSLAAKMDAWAASLNAALSHLPASTKLDASPAPQGQALEIRFTVTDKAKPKDILVVPFASSSLRQFATDHLEFDLATSPDTPRQGNWFYSPFKGSETAATIQFKKGEGIDQFGRDQPAAPEMRKGPGTWEHRVIGLCGQAPGALARHALVLRGGRPGTYTVYLDNLRLRHADGTTTPIWTQDTDTRSKKIADTELFKNLAVRAVTEYPTVQQAHIQREAAKEPIPSVAHDLTALHDATRVLVNPHKGWYHHFPDNHVNKYQIARDADLLEFPGMDHLYMRLAWAYLEPKEGQFDWAVIDSLIEKWTAHGLGIAFRISCKETGTDRIEQQYATPRWVKESGAQGGHYRMGQPVGPEGPWEPQYDDPIFLQKLERFLAAFAARYDRRPWLRYVDIGSIGDWGEGHCGAGSRKTLSFAVRKQHVDLHLKYFKHARLVISDDYVHALPDLAERARLHQHILANNISYRDDSIMVNGYFSSTSDRFTVRSPEFFADAYLRTPTVLELEHYGSVKKPGNWEGRPESAVAKYGKGKTGPDFLRGALELLHATYIGYHGDAREWLDDNPALTRELLNRSGYWLFPVSLELPDTLVAGRVSPLRVTLDNRGVAPPYHSYTLRVRLSGNGRSWVGVVGKAERSWLPGAPVSVPGQLDVPSDLKPGRYAVSLGLFDGSRPVEFALQEKIREPDGYYRVAEVLVAAARETGSAALAVESSAE